MSDEIIEASFPTDSGGYFSQKYGQCKKYFKINR